MSDIQYELKAWNLRVVRDWWNQKRQFSIRRYLSKDFRWNICQAKNLNEAWSAINSKVPKIFLRVAYEGRRKRNTTRKYCLVKMDVPSFSKFTFSTLRKLSGRTYAFPKPNTTVHVDGDRFNTPVEQGLVWVHGTCESSQHCTIRARWNKHQFFWLRAC